MSTKKRAEQYTSYDALCAHPFFLSAVGYGARVKAAIQKQGELFKVAPDYKREPTQAEYYCIAVGHALTNVLSICAQLEHCILYFSSFSPTEKMKKVGITKQSHLLYCIENYIIRTQSMYDRLLKLIDKVFELYNPSNKISHTLIIGNQHIRQTPVPGKLKALRKIIKPYYHDRNVIIHKQQYLAKDIRALEGYTILLNSIDNPSDRKLLSQFARELTKIIVSDKNTEFSKVNRESFAILGRLFDDLNEKYLGKRKILESLYGKSEQADLSG